MNKAISFFVVLAMMAAYAGADVVLFSDDFNSGTAGAEITGWTAASGNLGTVIYENSQAQWIPAVPNRGATSYTYDFAYSLRDGEVLTLEAQVQGVITVDVGIAIHTENNTITAKTRVSGSGGTAYFIPVVSGEGLTGSLAYIPYSTDMYNDLHSLKIELSETTVTLFSKNDQDVDWVQKAQFTGTPGDLLSIELVGLVNYNDFGTRARWDNVSLTSNYTASTFLEGDANGDGVVSAGDYASVQANFGNTGQAGISGDANGDGVVSAGDYASVQANFGATSATQVTPEPATMGLLLLAVPVLVRKKSHRICD